MKKIITLMLAFAMALALCACGQSSNSGTETKGAETKAAETTKAAENEGSGEQTTAAEAGTLPEGDITVGEDGEYTLTCAGMSDPGTFGPYGSGGAFIPYNNVLYESLACVTPDGEIQNIILKNYEDKGNGVYELEIYDYVHDTNGNPVKASDVVFSFEKAKENGSYAAILTTLKEIKTTGDYTLEMTLENERAGNFLGILTTIKIVTEAAWNASSDNMVHDVCGTSPYKLTDFIEGSSATMERVDDYWQTDKSLLAYKQLHYPKTIVWVIISDNSQTAAAIESGEIDHAMVVSADNYGLFVDENGNAKDGYAVEITVNNLTYGLTFNCGEGSICSDINIRKAIATSIDNDAIAASAFKGYGRAVGNYVNEAYLDYDESMEHADTYYHYDPDQAKKYLDEANYNGEPVRLLITGNRNAKGVMVFLESYMSAIGLNVEMQQLEQAAFIPMYYDEKGSDWDVVFTVDQGATGADYLYNVLYAADENMNSFGNLLHIKDAKLQELYDAMAGKDTNSTETVQALLDHIEENCYMYGLVEGYKVNIGSKRIKQLSVDCNTNINSQGCILED